MPVPPDAEVGRHHDHLGCRGGLVDGNPGQSRHVSSSLSVLTVARCQRGPDLVNVKIEIAWRHALPPRRPAPAPFSTPRSKRWPSRVRPRSACRDVARRAGVSHAAPTHHFGDKTGLLTALAAEGWSLLADALTEAGEQKPSFAELGVTYVVFATAHPAHFAVMRAPGLVRGDDPELAAAQQRAGDPAGGRGEQPRPRRHAETRRPPWPGGPWCTASRRCSWRAWSGPNRGTDVATLARSVTARLRPGG